LDVRSDSRFTTTFASASKSGTVRGAFLHELKIIRHDERGRFLDLLVLDCGGLVQVFCSGQIATLSAGVHTRGIMGLILRHIDALEPHPLGTCKGSRAYEHSRSQTTYDAHDKATLSLTQEKIQNRRNKLRDLPLKRFGLFPAEPVGRPWTWRPSDLGRVWRDGILVLGRIQGIF